jgi:UDP-2-acetamido-2,6-beta-L-arabino-hexul-4-ose reductase
VSELRVLITGSAGFIGRNLRSFLESQGFHRLLLIDKTSSEEEFKQGLKEADFIFHLAGVNRPVDDSEFLRGNSEYSNSLIKTLLSLNKKTPIVFASSTQVELKNQYGISKLEAEESIKNYSISTGAEVHILRLPNVFGKWAKPHYNSVVATFCHNVARGLSIDVHDPDKFIELLYIDDLVERMYRLITRSNEPKVKDHSLDVHTIRVGELANRIIHFNELRLKSQLPTLLTKFDKALFSTYTSHLPLDALCIDQKTHLSDGSRFTELMQTKYSGQFSLNVIEPGVEKGNHWHQSKHEKYIVIQGLARIRLRRKYDAKVHELIADSGSISTIDIPPGVVHSISNIGNIDLITIMWANEIYDSLNPDTFKEDV